MNYYSVIRFSASADLLEKYGKQVNCLVPGTYDALSVKRGMFSLTAADTNDWDDQHSKIVASLKEHSQLIKSAIQDGVDVQLDVAIYRQKHDALVSGIYFSPECARTAGNMGVPVVVSIYSTDSDC